MSDLIGNPDVVGGGGGHAKAHLFSILNAIVVRAASIGQKNESKFGTGQNRLGQGHRS